MFVRKSMAKRIRFGSVLGVTLFALVAGSCSGHAGLEDGGDSDHPSVVEAVAEPDGGDSGGEHGGSESGEGRGGDGEEHGSGGDAVGAGPDGGGESSEAAMSSPITPLGRSWTGVLGGLAVSMRYEAATGSVHGTVRNNLSETVCYVQAEPHLKSGTRTVGELGPEKLGHLAPGQETTSSLSVAGEPELAGVSYDGYVVHMEVFDCSGPGPSAHAGGEGAEGSGENGPGGEEGGHADALGPDGTFDEVRSGVRLILRYDAAANSFVGTVENTTKGPLARVRIEVHLSNGTELGPTGPADMVPGQVLEVSLPSTAASFTGWTAHAEVGEGGESGEEHGTGGERGGGAEPGGEHDGGGERRGDGQG